MIETPGDGFFARSTSSVIGSVEGGDCRGLGATDLQTSRTVSSEVASGDYSFIGGGQSNLAGATGTVVVGGSTNSATGMYSTVGGGS